MKEKILIFIINIIWQYLKMKNYKKIYLDLIVSIIFILFLVILIYMWIIFTDILKGMGDINSFQMLLFLILLVLFYIIKIMVYLKKDNFLMKKVFLVLSIIIEIGINLYFIL
jgi:hypothetical protein